MSLLSSAANRVETARSTLVSASRRLADVWRDRFHAAFQRDTLVPIETGTRGIAEAIRAADRRVDAVWRALRELGANL